MLRRSAISSSTTYTIYAFGQEEHIYNGSGAIQSSNYYYTLAGRELGKSTGSSALTFYLSDALGSILTSFSGVSGTNSASGTQTYGPYGNQQFIKGQLGTNKGFTGQYNDSLTGLDDFGARYYDAAVGVFLAADSVMGNLAGANPYAYVGGNPETFSDPSGRMSVPVSGEGGSAPTGPLTGGTGWTFPRIPIPFNFNAGGGNVVGGNAYTKSSSGNTFASTCGQVVPCRSIVNLDTGSSWTSFVSLSCLGAALDSVCISTTLLYRVNNPPPNIILCTMAANCDGEGAEAADNSNEEKATGDMGGGLASDESGPAGSSEKTSGDSSSPTGGNRGQQTGQQRIQYVKSIINTLFPGAGDYLAENLDVITNRGSTDIDLLYENLALEVGGPMKADQLSVFGTKLQRLTIFANLERVALAFAYDSTNGPISPALQQILDSWEVPVQTFNLPGVP